MRKVFVTTLLILFVLLAPTASLAQADPHRSVTEYVKGEVLQIVEEDIKGVTESNLPIGYQTVRVKVTTGKLQNQVITIENILHGNPTVDCFVKVGDKLLLVYQEFDGELRYISIEDHEKDTHIYYLLGLFVALLLVIGKGQGLKSVITLVITTLTIAVFMLPLLFAGSDPVIVALISSLIITVLTLLIIGGVTRKAIAAIIGTSGGLLIASGIATYFGRATHLRGMVEDEAQILLFTQGIGIDFRGLLFAGMIIGALGAVMDVSMSIASSMEEISSIGRGISMAAKIKSGMNIGNDIMGTMTNTLILAYTGASLPLILSMMAYKPPLLKTMNADFLAVEIIRSLSGSIGLVLAIPITAAVAGLLMQDSGHRGR